MLSYNALVSIDSSLRILGNIWQGGARLLHWILDPCLPDDDLRTALCFTFASPLRFYAFRIEHISFIGI
ncbi:uncharacterized protein L3040_004299 [Drepanopeziza brunnea f. sp. 'multigermtubi']|uniref:uncharacterized protein n=1 Tax=Drepanopeziza brunnea f. sp. 'multigermtubi' TaxID=698441 RepID=UPI0023A061C4|nr:hypothetical protein L3040_004299 [Drepanopeziza brunnea f. sp. 'multigermtubi']